MKRRSARPFMVEVKSARTARASLASPETRTRPDTNLWPELAQAEMTPPRTDVLASSTPRPAQKEAEAPVRRVLPSLVPMFQIPAEPESEPEAVTQPVRRGRTRRERAPAVTQAAPAVPAMEPAKPAPPAALRPESVAEAPARRAQVAEGGEGPSPRPATWRRTKELRLGERWKRRLPHFAR